MRLATVLLALALFLGHSADASRILGYFITSSRSHYIIHESLMRGLAAKGHDVTIVSHFPAPKNPAANIRYIQLHMSPETDQSVDQMRAGLSDGRDNFLSTIVRLFSEVQQMNVESLNDPVIAKLKRDESFDGVVLGWFLNEYILGLAEHFKCPAIVVSTMPAGQIFRDYVGNPTGASHTPFLMLPYTQMTFFQRVVNMLASMFEAVLVELMNRFYFEPTYLEHFPPGEYPSLAEARKNVALALVTSHFSQNAPMASFPSLVEVGGMHIPKEPNELPKNIKEWLDTAKHGVVFFSMGTNAKSTGITPERREAILKVFSRIKQRVLWKWEDDELAGRPDNVMIQKWVPQSDILAHKNVRLFITHCGKGSINEARFRGVPLLGIPLFGDQPNNLDLVVDEGWAVPLQYADLNEQTFAAALEEALTNPKYGDVVRKSAELFVDRPMHPLDTAVYWTEYVIRHKGAKHMQSQAVHLNWFQYHSLDVLSLIAIVLFVSFKLTLFFWRFVIAAVFRRSTKVKKQ